MAESEGAGKGGAEILGMKRAVLCRVLGAHGYSKRDAVKLMQRHGYDIHEGAIGSAVSYGRQVAAGTSDQYVPELSAEELRRLTFGESPGFAGDGRGGATRTAEMHPMRDLNTDLLLTLLRKKYPDWSDFQHPGFRKDEIDYKRSAAEKASELLGEDEFKRLVDAEDFDELTNRLGTVARATNLLFLGVPSQGDLAVLYQEDLDRATFFPALLDLLHGDGDGPNRLGRFLDYLRRSDLVNKWTFPTYYLFLLHPDEEMFVKPSATTAVMGLLGFEESYVGEPSVAKYEVLRKAMHQLLGDLSDLGARDLIDVQSLLWVAYAVGRETLVSDATRAELGELIREMAGTYLETPDGLRHLRAYREEREQAAENWRRVREAESAGEDITDLVLDLLLPHADTEKNRARGVWVNHAPAAAADIRKLFESVGFVQPGDWPDVAKAIVAFLGRCLDDPEQLADACTEFADSPYSKGFQTGMLTPLLSALRPDDCLLVNNKSRLLINHLANTTLRQSLEDYPEANRVGNRLVEELEPLFADAGMLDQLEPTDAFDAFSHWMVAVKNYPFGQQYWKVAPGEQAFQWEECREGGFIGIGWEGLGDVSGLSRKEFEERLDAALKEHPDWTKGGPRQVWTFSRIKEGDRIVANKGTSEVLGIGTVVGPYYFQEGVTYGHRLPVEWDDTTRRRVDEGGWRRTVIKLDRQKFEAIQAATVLPGGEATRKARAALREEAFELLQGLAADPTKDFYQQHREDFDKHLEKPFQELLLEVAARLPDDVKKVLETEKGLFGRIPKNDWGRGGAWPFYWGAFYPAGGRRIEDAQLYAWVDHRTFGFGFMFGAYSSAGHARFLANVARLRSTLLRVLPEHLPMDRVIYGARESQESVSSFAEWLADPEKYGVQLRIEIAPNEVLEKTREQLAEEIAVAFRALFPLFLLSLTDDPLPEIEEYLHGEDTGTPTVNPPYPLRDLAEESGFPEALLERWARAIERKQQAILFGPPGTGKTYVAQRLARHLIGGHDGFWELVQFHPAYSYEDFLQGLRPRRTTDGALTYDMARGRFFDFCDRARKLSPEGRAVLIIDEINRANLARVFGELMYLLEYRDQQIPLAGGGPFKIPSNVRLLGTMNTADRSIALVDHALRRRFAFLRLEPKYDVLRRFHDSRSTGFDPEGLIGVLERLNHEIRDGNYSVGITFFLLEDLADEVEDVWRMEVEPYVREFFFDRPQRADAFSWDAVATEVLGEG